MTVTIDDFQRLDMRVGMIVDVADLPEARKPSYKLRIDFGPLGTRHSAAALKTEYAREELLHRQVVCVFNPPLAGGETHDAQGGYLPATD